MSLRLYHAPNTRSDRALWALRELGAPHALVPVDLAAGEHRAPPFLALNPHGEVPVLLDGDVTLYDPTAIVLHLCDRFAHKGFAPAVTALERARYYQFALYAAATLDPLAEQAALLAARGAEGEGAVPLAREREALRARVSLALRVLAGRLAAVPFLVGPRCSGADLCVGSALDALERAAALGDAPPAVRDYHQRLRARPAHPSRGEVAT